jgi:hypothetical protein
MGDFRPSMTEVTMKGSFAVVALAAALLSGACSQPISPVSPASGRAGTLSAGPASLASSAQSVPFKGGFEGTTTFTPLQPPLGAVNGSGSGTGTLLGQFTVAFPHTVNFVTQVGEGTFTFTAANGDTLTAPFTGLATRAGGPTVSVVEHATITGGTGRFAGATGTFTVERTFDEATGATSGSFVGSMSF